MIVTGAQFLYRERHEARCGYAGCRAQIAGVLSSGGIRQFWCCSEHGLKALAHDKPGGGWAPAKDSRRA